MTLEFMVSDSVKELVNQIIAKKNLKGISDIKYQPGSQAGDGYISKTVAVEIITETGPFTVFIKCALNVKSTDSMPINKLYQNEIYFYDKIYPEFLKFCQQRGIENSLRKIPICYGTGENIVALENLKEKHFTMYDRTKPMNDAHIELVLKTFAKVHAIAYAFKDQEREKYDGLLENVFDFFSTVGGKRVFESAIRNTINDFITNLNPHEDRDLLEKCDGIFEKIFPSISSANKTLNEYSILMQGDCHCNNMMFIYEKENAEVPSDIVLVDWQCIRAASPVFDLSYFFYAVASEEALNNLTYYLKLYHKELSEGIRSLGSDPAVLYPYEILEKEWKQNCKYGFSMAFHIIRIMLAAGDEIFNAEKFDFEDPESSTQSIVPTLEKQDVYQNRVKILVKHMFKNDFI